MFAPGPFLPRRCVALVSVMRGIPAAPALGSARQFMTQLRHWLCAAATVSIPSPAPIKVLV
jgi:hypothetical protein